MNNKEKIILYLDGQLNETEKINFEKELKSSSGLRSELENYKRFLSVMKEDVQLNQKYFNEIIPKFRQKVDKRKEGSFLPKIVYGVSTAAAVFLIFLILFTNVNDKKTTLPENDYTESIELLEETNQLYFNGSTDEYNSLLNSMIAEELNAGYSVSVIVSEYELDVSEAIDNLDENEMELVYNEILNKKFF